MSCRICGRSSCIESFHSIKEQERAEHFENIERLAAEVVKARQVVKQLRGERESLEFTQNDVEEIRAVVHKFGDYFLDFGKSLSSIADRIEALIPPEKCPGCNFTYEVGSGEPWPKHTCGKSD